MKYIFLGTPEFAAIILEKLIKAGLMPEAAICNADKPTGRKQILTPPAVKVAAQKYGLTVYQPKDKVELLEIVKKLQPDLAMVAAFGMIFTKEILDAVPQGFINVHPSLLPRWRGASPIQATILNGDKETGVSLILLDEKVDHGAIIANSKFRIKNSEWNYESLSKKLAELGADLFIETLPKFINGEIIPLLQDESQATYAKKIKTEDAFIEPEDLAAALQGGEPRPDGREKAIEIDRKIRALNPEPGTWTLKDGKRMKLLEAELIENKPRRPEGVGAPTYTSVLKLKKIQFEGKKPIVYN